MTGARAASTSEDNKVSGGGAPGDGGRPKMSQSGPEIRLETTRDGRDASNPRRRGAAGARSPTTAREKCAGSDHTGGWGSGD